MQDLYISMDLLVPFFSSEVFLGAFIGKRDITSSKRFGLFFLLEAGVEGGPSILLLGRPLLSITFWNIMSLGTSSARSIVSKEHERG